MMIRMYHRLYIMRACQGETSVQAHGLLGVGQGDWTQTDTAWLTM